MVNFYFIIYTIKAYKPIVEPILTGGHIEKRLIFARWWRKDAGDFKKLPIMFSDEKIFTVDVGL